MRDWILSVISYLEPYVQFPYIIQHILDIAIVSYVLYKCLLLIKATRAEQVLKGLAVLLICTKLSEILRFNTIYWILKNTVTVGIIAILIVFQPELRRALEQIGRGKLFDRATYLRSESDPMVI